MAPPVAFGKELTTRSPQRVGEYLQKSGQKEFGYSPTNFTSKQLQNSWKKDDWRVLGGVEIRCPYRCPSGVHIGV